MSLPKTKPALTLPELQSRIVANGGGSLLSAPLYFVGIRGYYSDMGVKGKNDRGIYDDALFIVSKNGLVSFNANTDPSVKRSGIASLVPGIYTYSLGKHGVSRPGGGYLAFRQASSVRVLRDGTESYKAGQRHSIYGICLGNGMWTDEGQDLFWINIHKGGYNTTSSLGCQTIYPTQWEAFQTLGYLEAKRLGTTKIPYILI